MAAPTSAVHKLQKILANAGPSTHGLLHALQLNHPKDSFWPGAAVQTPS
jgi:hypothetical protein